MTLSTLCEGSSENVGHMAHSLVFSTSPLSQATARGFQSHFGPHIRYGPVLDGELKIPTENSQLQLSARISLR